MDNRPDVLTWKTEPLTEDVTVAGNVIAKIFASTTGSDADWIVKLIDVYPEKVEEDWKLSGYELMIAEEIFRGRYRNSFEKPEAITPNQVTPFTVDLHSANHVFKKGHRIMVQVQSTWFPLYDRNPQKFVPNIFEAKDADYQKATQTIYRSEKYPSRVEGGCVAGKELDKAEIGEMRGEVRNASYEKFRGKPVKAFPDFLHPEGTEISPAQKNLTSDRAPCFGCRR